MSQTNASETTEKENGTKNVKRKRVSDKCNKRDKFNNLRNSFVKNEEEWFICFLEQNGFIDPSSFTTGNKNKSNNNDTYGKLIDELFCLLIDNSYDNCLFVDIDRMYNSLYDRPVMHDHLENGPLHYVPLNERLSIEGKMDKNERNQIRKQYKHMPLEKKMFQVIGGAMKMSPEAKEYLSSIRNNRMSSIIQKSSVIAQSDGKRSTIMSKDVLLSLQIE